MYMKNDYFIAAIGTFGMSSLGKRDFTASPYRSEREKVICISRWNVLKFFKLLGKF